jgi:hypothetical protein
MPLVHQTEMFTEFSRAYIMLIIACLFGFAGPDRFCHRFQRNIFRYSRECSLRAVMYTRVLPFRADYIKSRHGLKPIGFQEFIPGVFGAAPHIIFQVK